MKKIEIDDFASALMEELSEYSDEVAEKIKKDTKEVADKCVEEIRERSPKSTGAYKDGWGSETTLETRKNIQITIRNKKKYRITHLLENGHAKVNGGRVEGIVHIRIAEQNAEKMMVEKVKEAVR